MAGAELRTPARHEGADLLHGWLPGGKAPEDLQGRIIAHPRFAAAVCALAWSMVDAIRARSDTSHAGVDAGRYVARLAAIWLDTRDELALPALKALCASSGLLSKGRARSFLQYLLHVGDIVQVEAAGGQRAARYEATARFRAKWIAHLRGPIGAAALIAPAARQLLERLGEPTVAAIFTEIQAGTLLRAAPSLPAGEPVVETYYHPAGGLQVLALLVAGAADIETFPSRRPVRLPVTATAEAIGVSAPQLKRILRRAEAHGLLTAHPGPAYAMTERADGVLRFIYAAQLAQLLDAVAQTLARLSPTGQPARVEEPGL